MKNKVSTEYQIATTQILINAINSDLGCYGAPAYDPYVLLEEAAEVLQKQIDEIERLEQEYNILENKYETACEILSGDYS